MDDTLTFVAYVLFGAIGLGYFVYGRRQNDEYSPGPGYTLADSGFISWPFRISIQLYTGLTGIEGDYL